MNTAAFNKLPPGTVLTNGTEIITKQSGGRWRTTDGMILHPGLVGSFGPWRQISQASPSPITADRDEQWVTRAFGRTP